MAASSLTTCRTPLAMSSGRTMTPAGVVAVIASSCARGASLPGVRVAPGATVFTRTPRGPYSAAQLRVSCSSAALVAVYIATKGLPTRAIQEPMVTMTPLPRS